MYNTYRYESENNLVGIQKAAAQLFFMEKEYELHRPENNNNDMIKKNIDVSQQSMKKQ